jgi:hypothetical protein
MRIKAGLLDWSGHISDDRLPVYEANMKVFNYYGKNEFVAK